MQKKLTRFISTIGSTAFSIAVIVVLLIISLFFIFGGMLAGALVLKYLFIGSAVAAVICILVLLPLSFFQTTRNFSATWFLRSSYLFGLTLWFWSILLTYKLWGITAVFFGLILFGIGVAPIALLATLFNGMWSVFAQLILLVLLTFGLRFFSAHLFTKSYPSYLSY